MAVCSSPYIQTEKKQEYRITFSVSGTSMKVQWKWGDENIKNGVDATELQAVEGKRMIAGMLGDLIGQNESLLHSSQRLEAVADRLKDIDRTLAAAQSSTAGQQQQVEEGMFRKFSAALSEKKRRIKKLSAECGFSAVDETDKGHLRLSALGYANESASKAYDTAASPGISPAMKPMPVPPLRVEHTPKDKCLREVRPDVANNDFDSDYRGAMGSDAVLNDASTAPMSPSAQLTSPAASQGHVQHIATDDEIGYKETRNLFLGNDEALLDTRSLKIRKRPRKLK
eukprot:CAMPEP_0177761760 /NCGR_PEP_ID=MMETSP0491_2-20121128/5979_1 /TAXON_ID=63592 /ORGANISM="Tetraselmis chuii, Strain PLY429" /LENGTH=283 /DNA_ID=CAMNT_0019277761 /DNA_START=2021 /DNA_END=2872 /DNA_ORIENTATION=-